MVGIPEGMCPKCGFECHGWALYNPRHQTCRKCGEALIITDSDGTLFQGYSPFEAEKNIIIPPGKVAHKDERANSSYKNDKDSSLKDE